MLLQHEVAERPELADEGAQGLVGRLQLILYSTEEGFEIPDEALGEEDGEMGEGEMGEAGAGAGDEETF